MDTIPVIDTARMAEDKASQLRKVGLEGYSISELAGITIEFAELISGKDYYGWQKEFGRAVIASLIKSDADELTITASRQSGKTEVIAGIQASVMILFPTLAKTGDKRFRKFRDGVWVGIFAPRGEQCATLYGRCKRILGSSLVEDVLADPDVDAELKAGSMLSNGSFVFAQSLYVTTKVESKTYHLINIDEAQDCDDYKVRKSVHPMAAHTVGTIVKSGVPARHRSDFYEAIQRNIKRGKSHFQYDWRVCSRQNPDYAVFIEAEKKRIGAESEEFLLSYELKWLLELGMFIGNEMNFEGYCDKSLRTATHLADGLQFGGLDVAKEKDSTVATVMDIRLEDIGPDGMAMRKTIADWHEWSGVNYEAQYNEITAFFDSYHGLKRICTDATKEATLSDFLINYYEGRVEVEPLFLSPTRQSEMYKTLAKSLRNGLLVFPAAPSVRKTRKWRRFREQLLNAERYWRGHIMIVHAATGYHDDYVDSLALCDFAEYLERWAGGYSASVNLDTRAGRQQYRRPRARSYRR